MKSMLGVLALLAIGVGPTRAQEAQRFTVSGAVQVYMAEQLAEIERRQGDFCCEFETVRPSAALLGGEVSVQYRWIGLTVAGLMGEPSLDDGVALDEDLRLTTVALHAVAGSWLSFGPEIDVWRSKRVVLGARRDLIMRRLGVSVAVSGSLGVPGLRGTFGGSIYPLGTAHVSGLGSVRGYILGEGSDVNNRLRVGLEYRPGAAPVWFALRYRTERFANFEARSGAFGDDLFVERSQLRGIDFTVGADLGR